MSESLAAEAATYPVRAKVEVFRNILPRIPQGPLDARHREFAERLRLDLRRPVLVNPVRVFRTKGVEIAVELLAGMKHAARMRSFEVPYLLVFGSLKEDPDYTSTVMRAARDLDVVQDVRFLDGLPLESYRTHDGVWRLDDVDVLRLASASSGGVVFTPNVPDYEAVGLGPGLAAAAYLPCAVTDYDAFDVIYGPDFWFTKVGPSHEDIRNSGEAFLDVLVRARRRDAALRAQLAANKRLVRWRFPTGPWKELWQQLATAVGDGVQSPW